MKVEIGGHTDAQGSDSFNLKLSERRAQAVKDYLIARGIAPERLLAKGYGESQAVDSN
jgi:OOP family OmpA-OmpF porin